MINAITTDQQLQAAMLAEETEHLEFKSAERKFASEELFGYCVALSNEGGGSLVLGVTDKKPRSVVGTSCFPNIAHIKTRILDALKFRVDVSEIMSGGKRVLVFNCPARPVGTPRSYKGRYMMRSGESLIPMTPEVLEQIFAESQPDYSSQVCVGATIDDLSPDAIAEFRARWVRKSGNHALEGASERQILEDAHLLNNDGVTFAALILLGNKSSLTRFLPQAELIFEYRQNDASIEYQDRLEYRAGFFLWANDIWEKISVRNEKHSYKEGLFRYEISAFNEDVVREALLNAVTHREYRDGRSVFVRQYPDRLEITSPGGFPDGVTAENIIYRQHPRNRRIAEALQFCGLVERSGQGADRMFRVCIQEGKNRPSFAGSDEFLVTLTLDGQIRDPRFVQYLERLARERGISLNINDFLVLDLVRKGEMVPDQLRDRLAHLIEQGVIEKAGRGRGVRQILSHALYQHVGQSGSYTRRKGLDEGHNQQLVLQHIRNCGVNGASITEFEQVLPSKTRPQISGILKRLKKAGKIRVEGKTKGARWFLQQTEHEQNN